MLRTFLCLPCVALLTAAAFAQEEADLVPVEPGTVAAASDEAQEAISGFVKPAGFKVQLFAAEPMVANPVSFYIDNQGRAWVCETFRQKHGVEDNRNHSAWLEDDLAAQSLEDRLAYFKKHLGEKIATYAKYEDRIRLVEDTDGDGAADTAEIFADGFDDVLDGTGAGVLEHRGTVYYTCIPHLWILKDKTGDNIADIQRAAISGFGVRVAFRGHDMHGLTIGPDGRLYFSIGDRGYNVLAEGRRWANPESGAVFRCELDGSNFEVVATGMRNPQELAFDDYGNLFTGDNNSDSGDKARWVYVVEGGDSGWRMAYQYLADRGPFNREQIWQPYSAETPASIIPPVANVADGPSGLAYYPGTGLSDEYKGRFFLCDFRGGPENSGVRSFRVKPQGAFFELTDEDDPFWNILATDIQFGPDGGVYISDWVSGWDGVGKGRIYKFSQKSQADGELTAEVKQLLAAGPGGLTAGTLAKQLSHPDRRVRQQAQFELVARKDKERLYDIAANSDHQFARLHALWGLGQLGRIQIRKQVVEPLLNLPEMQELCLTLLKEPDPELRAQAAKMIGELDMKAAVEPLMQALNDDNLRVRYFAALSLGKVGDTRAIEPLIAMLEENNNQDPILRHGGVMGLAGCADDAQLVKLAEQPSPAVRLGALLALRRQASPNVATFLHDEDPRLVLEAARAIHDEPITDELPALAALIERKTDSDPLLRRVLNANYRLGQPANAAAVARFAAAGDGPEAMRLEALEMLAAWTNPSNRDRVLGMWRPLDSRDQKIAVAAVRETLPELVAAPDKIRIAGLQAATELRIAEAVGPLQKLAGDKSQPGNVRGAALQSLVTLAAPGVDQLIREALTDDDARVRAASRTLLAQQNPAEGIAALGEAVDTGETIERQQALQTLARLGDEEANKVLVQSMTKLLKGEIPPDTQLDVLEAAQKAASSELAALVNKYEAALPADDAAAKYQVALLGGDAERGRKIFYERTEVSCVRCHKINELGGEVGPNLSKIGGEKQRDYLLDAIVAPNKAIAKNFESAVIATDEGKILTGIVKQEDAETIRIMTADAKLIDIEKDSIEARRAGKSAMPEDLLKNLSTRDVRDLVEYLSSLKQ